MISRVANPGYPPPSTLANPANVAFQVGGGEAGGGTVVNMTTANHLVPNLVIPANFDSPIQTAIKVSAKALCDTNASTPRILAVGAAELVSDLVGTVAKQR